jgi:hypothetical protein
MTDAHTLLTRHVPRLVYDSQEAYFADLAAIWTDSPANVLKRADGHVLAKPPKLALSFLGPTAYADGTPVQATDTIGESTHDYAKHAAALHGQVRYANRVHGHARRDSHGSCGCSTGSSTTTTTSSWPARCSAPATTRATGR